jgi:hypothetical protein
MYTIELCDDGKTAALPMFFADREDAVASARALLKSGFPVHRIVGPGFEVTAPELMKRERYPRRNGSLQQV